jgi:predicted TIM-barrel fold metal-dependent hydrolase
MIYFDAFTVIGPRAYANSKSPWSLDHLLDELDLCSISGAMVFGSMQTQYDTMLENRRLLRTLAPHDHLFPIWGVLPSVAGDFPEPRDLLKEMADHDVRAVSMFPKGASWSLFSDWNQPLLQSLSDAAIPVIFRCPDQLSLEDADRLAKAWPALPIILTGPTWGTSRSVFPLLVNRPNVHLTFTHFQVYQGLELLVESGCGNQLLFASNAPEMSAGAHRTYVDYANLPVPAKEAIAGGNLSRLLKGLKPPRERRNPREDELMAAARQGLPMPCLTLDMHAHIQDEGAHNVGTGSLFLDGGPQGMARMAKRMGVQGIGVMSWNGTVGTDAANGNDCVRAAMDACPDLFWGLATFDTPHLDRATLRRQLEETYADRRFLGLKPYPSFGIPYDDPRYDVWWEFGNEQGLYVGFHPTLWYQNREFIKVAERFPNLTIMAYHAGGSYESADAVIEAGRKFKNIMAEPTLTPVCGRIIEHLVEGLGEDRVCYGSDQPMRDPRQQLGWVVYTRLPLDVKKKILGLNAKRLLDGIRNRP